MQSMSVGKRQLGERGNQYLREQLADSAPFSEALIQYLDKGFTWEFATREQLESSEVMDFHVGGLGATSVSNEYVEFLCELRRGDPSITLLFENQLFRLTDPVMLGKTGLFEWAGAIYSYLPTEKESVTETTVMNHRRSAGSYPSIVVVTRLPRLLGIEQPRSLIPEEASELEAGVKHILVGAYDEESYVAWSRAD